ncbi:MAG: DUF5316 family protein [Bacillus sp. (in: firmicutes)]
MVHYIFIAGACLVIIAGIISGERQRTNFHTETKEERSRKLKWSSWFFVSGILLLLVAVGILLISTN